MTKTNTQTSRFANSSVWQEKALDAAHRAELSASFDGEVSEDWLDDEGEFDGEDA